MNKKLHPQTLAIRGGKEQTEYREHNQALFLTSSFMWERRATCGRFVFPKKIKGFYLYPVQPIRLLPLLKNALPHWKAQSVR